MGEIIQNPNIADHNRHNGTSVTFLINFLIVFAHVSDFSVGNMESPSVASWLSSTRLYMITRVSAGYG